MASGFEWKNTKEVNSDAFSYGTSGWRLKSKKCTAILFYKPGCPYCQKMKGEWDKFAGMLKGTGMEALAINCDYNNEFQTAIRDDLPALIVSYPTMLIFKNGKPERGLGNQGEESRRAEIFKKECVGLCLGKNISVNRNRKNM